MNGYKAFYKGKEKEVFATYAIMSKEEGGLFWSNSQGWASKHECDEFTEEEKETFNLPMNGEWITLEKDE